MLHSYDLCMHLGRLLRVGLAIMTAVALGVGTIFGVKANSDDHWSTSPKVMHVVKAQTTDFGPPGVEIDFS